MKPTEQLKSEHEAIETMLKILEEICARHESGEKLNAGHLAGIIDFIKVFADKCHHAKEEDLLFPAMAEAGIPREEGPIGVMLSEHNMGRDFVRGLSEAVEKYKAGIESASAEIIENARNYINLLRQHIPKENDILYPMADTVIDQEKQNQLLKEFERMEEEKIGAGKHEEFHKFLEELKEIYLPPHHNEHLRS